MSSLTTNLKLVKPELQDNITPTIFADNFDKIDAAIEGVSGGALSLEEIEASTNLDGKIPSAAALKEVNNSLGGLKFGVDSNGNYGYIKAGADTVTPFSSYDVKKSNAASSPGTVSITVPSGVKKGALVCVSTGWQAGISQDTPSGGGIKSINQKYNANISGVCSNTVRIFECEFNEGKTISMTFRDIKYSAYPTAQLILLA